MPVELSHGRGGAAALVLALSLGGCAQTGRMPEPSDTGEPTLNEFTVIAHRGASGYLPEHTLEAAAMAHAMGVDYIEQDVVLTRDGELVVLHDLFLDEVTDVARRFPGRQRNDGRHYAIDFTLAELQALQVRERTGPDGRPAYPARFPPDRGDFRIPTLAQEIELIQGLNRSTGREVGIYVEPKSPAWHLAEGQDLVAAVVATLDRFGYRSRQDRALLQSFDPEALRHARETLGCELTLVQLIGENSWRESPADFDYLRTAAGLAEIAGFAEGIGPWIPQVIDFNRDGTSDISDLVTLAHANGLFVHAYTLRADRLPAGAASLDAAVRALVRDARLDGVFTDHPDQVLRALTANP